jgi:hypothetical protein
MTMPSDAGGLYPNDPCVSTVSRAKGRIEASKPLADGGAWAEIDAAEIEMLARTN